MWVRTAPTTLPHAPTNTDASLLLRTPPFSDDEKAYARLAALQALLTDPSARVATQLGLLLANVAGFDYPLPWETLLQDLSGAADSGSAVPAAGKLRALIALKHVRAAIKGEWAG